MIDTQLVLFIAPNNKLIILIIMTLVWKYNFLKVMHKIEVTPVKTGGI